MKGWSMATPQSFEFTEEEIVAHRRRSEVPMDREPYMVSNPMAFRVFTRSDLAYLPQGKWLMRAVIPEAGLTYLHGDSTAGKTLIALQWAFQLTRTSPQASWWGQERVDGPYKAMYMAGEGQGGLDGRLQGIEAVYGSELDKPTDNLLFVTESAALNPVTGTGAQALADLVRRLDLDVVFLDTMRWYFDGDENDSTAVQQLLNTVGLLNKMGCAVVVVHHNRKSDKQMRGSTAIFAACDTIISADAKSENGLYESGSVELEKQKDGPTWGTKYALREGFLPPGNRSDEDVPVLVQVQHKTSPQSRDIRREVIELLMEEHTLKSKVAGSIGANSNDVSTIIDQLLDEGIVAHTGNTRSPLYVVTSEEVESI